MSLGMARLTKVKQSRLNKGGKTWEHTWIALKVYKCS